MIQSNHRDGVDFLRQIDMWETINILKMSEKIHIAQKISVKVECFGFSAMLFLILYWERKIVISLTGKVKKRQYLPAKRVLVRFRFGLLKVELNWTYLFKGYELVYLPGWGLMAAAWAIRRCGCEMAAFGNKSRMSLWAPSRRLRPLRRRNTRARCYCWLWSLLVEERVCRSFRVGVWRRQQDVQSDQ